MNSFNEWFYKNFIKIFDSMFFVKESQINDKNKDKNLQNYDKYKHTFVGQ